MSTKIVIKDKIDKRVVAVNDMKPTDIFIEKHDDGPIKEEDDIYMKLDDSDIDCNVVSLRTGKLQNYSCDYRIRRVTITIEE